MEYDLINKTMENCSFSETDWNDTNGIPHPCEEPIMTLYKPSKGIKQVEMVLEIVCLLVGLIGNVTTVVLMRRRSWMSAVARIILTSLAISDTVMLITHTFNQSFVRGSLGLDPRGLSVYGCKIFFIFYRTSKMTSSWFIVFLCLERFIAITWPLKMGQIITVRRVQIYVAANYITMSIFNIILSFSDTVENGMCMKNDPAVFGLEALEVLKFLDMLIYSIAPIAINLFLTPVTIVKLRQYYMKKRRLHTQSNEEKSRVQRQIQELVRTSITLIAVTLTFVVTVFPMTIFQIEMFLQGLTSKDISQDYNLYQYKVIAQRLEQINYSINFFLYLLTSQNFRKHLMTCNS